MPNIRNKTWTPTTPAQTADAQFWEDHLIDDESYDGLQELLEGGGSGGGHTIQNAAGTAMPQRSILQFVNASVSDSDGKTIVSGNGEKGEAASVTVGTTTTGNPGTNASVVNVGTSSDAVLNFTIPRGATGAQGEQGIQGEQGVKGDPGDDGKTFTPIQGTTTTLPAGQNASVTMTVDTENNTVQYNFAIPRGAQGVQGAQGIQGIQGVQGEPGTTYTPIQGTTTTLDPGKAASVTMTLDTANNTVKYDFAIPRGQSGGGSGTVTSVGLSNTDSSLTVSGSPVTSSGSITVNHSNSVTAKTTQALYPIKFDSHGHITGSGSAVTIPTKLSQLTNDSGYITDAGVTSFNGSTGAVTYTAPVTSVNGNTGAVTLDIPETITKTVTVSASGWSGSVYTITDSDIPSASNGNITVTMPNVTTSASLETQIAAYASYDIYAFNQVAGAVSLYARGTTPTADIDIALIIEK